MAVVLTINGVAKNILDDGKFQLSESANGRSTFACTIQSRDGTYRPGLDDEVVLTDTDGTTVIFGGVIDHPSEQGVADTVAIESINTTISAVDYQAYTERRYVNETIPAGTLKAWLTTIVANYLTDYGVTLDAGQVDGPTLPELDYDYLLLTDAFNQVATITASSGEPFIWKISPTKVLSMYQPSTTPAPFNITQSPRTPEVLGDIEVEISRDDYANKIIVKLPSASEFERVETFTGDGTTTTFTLQYMPTATSGYVDVDGGYETLNVTGDADPAMWTFDPTANTITRNIGAPDNGAVIAIRFNGIFEGLGIAEDAGEIATRKLWERVVKVDKIPSDATAQSLADGYLAKALPPTQTVRYFTRASGLAVGQTQTITVARRDLGGDAVITDIVTTNYGPLLERRVTAVIDATLNNLERGWRDVYVAWNKDTAGTGGAALGSGGTGQSGPAPPNRSVQFNNAGRFGGDAEFIYYKDENSVVCGGGGSSIDAVLFESCQVFGFNNHIADP